MKEFDQRMVVGMDADNVIKGLVEKKLSKLDEMEMETDAIDYTIALVMRESDSYQEMESKIKYILDELNIFHRNIKKLVDLEDGVNV